MRYSWPATYAIYFGTLVVIVASANAPYRYHSVMGTFFTLWCGACALWCVAIWVSAAATREGRSSVAPWASGLAVAAKLIVMFTFFSDSLRRMFVQVVDGRPLRAGGESHRTGIVEGVAWSAAGAERLEPEPELGGVDWLKLAGDEHASVAAFSRLSLELLAAGAPPELVAATHRAALEEVEHAQLCFRVASLMTGRPCTAAPLPAAIAPLPPTDLARLAHESLTDGWLNEGAAARGIERLAAKTRTPWLREALERVAREEHRHAELGARIAQWCGLRFGPLAGDVTVRQRRRAARA